jgi:ribosomal-protein-alanine N-acetyltransferase
MTAGRPASPSEALGAEPFPVLDTARLVLREVLHADAPALFAIHGDAEAMKWFGTDPLADLAQAERVVANFAAGRVAANPGTRWAIERKSDGRFVGTCGLFKWNRGWRVCTTGYELAREAWGQGLMREALAAAFGWGFEHMALERIEAQVHPDNAASLGLLRRLGFADEGLAREAGFWLGQRHDMVQLGLLKREFQAS